MAGAAVRDRFNDIAAALEDAALSVPAAWDASVQWAGKTVRIRVAGQGLAGLVRRPMAHLVLGTGERQTAPDVSVHLSEPGDVPVVRVLREATADLITVWSAAGLEVRSSACGRIVSFGCGPEHLFLLDRRKRVVAGVQDPQRLLLFDRVKPLLVPLRICLRDMGVHLVHAGLVSRRDAGVLIGGPGGTGKSSAALRCFMAGFEFLGDDQSALSGSGDGFVGHSLYNAVQVDPVWLSTFGSIPAGAVDRGPGSEKTGVFLFEVTPECVRRSVPVRAVVLPRLAPGQPTATYPASKAQALMRIAPSTVFQPLGGVPEDVHALGRLLLRVPAHWLDLGEDPSRVPELVRQLLPGA